MSQKLLELLERVESIHHDLQALRPTLYDTQATPLQTALINLLGTHPEQTVPQLAARRKSSRQNIQVVINELITLGIVTTKPNPRHKRSVIYALTTIGEAIYAHNHLAYLSFLEKLAHNFEQKELEDSLQTLEKLSKKLNP